MANRVEIGEIVENATGINIDGASVTVKYHGGANAPVYDAENGGALVTQPLTTVNGKIGSDYPSGAWVAGDTDYDLLVTYGAETLTFFWPATRSIQFVTSLPAGVGTSAPEDAELAVQLYDGTNKAAWLRRYRAATSDWDMIGGPPPAGGSLPGTPIARQEFYVTGGTPAINHQRYNGASWDYVGTPPTVPVTGSPLSILEVGQSGHHRAGHELALADFSTLCALPTTPVLLANLTTLTSNLGSGGALVNKNTTLNGNGIDGSATAAQFRGASGTPANDPVLYIADTGAADPFRIKTGTVGAWVRTAKRSTDQDIVSKWNATVGIFLMEVTSTNVARFGVATATLSTVSGDCTGITDIADDRWHFIVGTHDGTTARLYVDGVLESSALASGPLITGGSAPLNIGGFGADAGTAVTRPNFGRVDEAFVTPDVLSDDQIRLIYAAKIPHGYSTTPTRAQLSVRRKRRGAALATSDFPSQPVRLHNLAAGALTDLGSGNVTLTANNSPVTVAGPDGTKDDAYNFITGSTQSLSSTDAGLPSGTSSRSYGLWIKTASTTNAGIMGWGTLSTNDARIDIITGVIRSNSGGDTMSGPYLADGLWHHIVVTEENAPTDLVKRKMYVDGRCVVGSTTLTSLTLAGANRFRIGANMDATAPWTGQASRAFVASVALTSEQIQVLYQKSSQALAASVRSDAGGIIEAMDATNVYAILEGIDSHNTIDLAVAA